MPGHGRRQQDVTHARARCCAGCCRLGRVAAGASEGVGKILDDDPPRSSRYPTRPRPTATFTVSLERAERARRGGGVRHRRQERGRRGGLRPRSATIAIAAGATAVRWASPARRRRRRARRELYLRIGVRQARPVGPRRCRGPDSDAGVRSSAREPCCASVDRCRCRIALAVRRALLRRAGRMLVRASALTTDGGGRSGVRRSTGTLIAARRIPSRARKLLQQSAARAGPRVARGPCLRAAGASRGAGRAAHARRPAPAGGARPQPARQPHADPAQSTRAAAVHVPAAGRSPPARPWLSAPATVRARRGRPAGRRLALRVVRRPDRRRRR